MTADDLVPTGLATDTIEVGREPRDLDRRRRSRWSAFMVWVYRGHGDPAFKLLTELHLTPAR